MVETLDRENLKFLANLIIHAQLAEPDKTVDANTQRFRVMAKIVAGAAHGFDPISSQSFIQIIHGRCVLSAAGMAVKFGQHPDLDLRIEQLDDTACKLVILRRVVTDGKPDEWIVRGSVTFTIEDAEAAGLTRSSPNIWKQYRQDLLYANAFRRAVRRFAPEIAAAEWPTFNFAAAATPSVKESGIASPAPSAAVTEALDSSSA